jgi:hypothetical protein
MNVLVYGAYLLRDEPVQYPFNRLIMLPLKYLFDSPLFPRRYFDVKSADSATTRALIEGIRIALSSESLRFAENGALDKNGLPVDIATLTPQTTLAGVNYAGFAKWVADGLLRPVTGQRLAIPPLKRPYGKRGSDFTRLYENTRAPFFALDWARNLANAVNVALYSPDFATQVEQEVRKSPFADTRIMRYGAPVVKPYPGYNSDAGFDMEGLTGLLYTLAVDEPHTFYLAVVNRVDGNPPLREYFHIAVLLPYFDEACLFHVAVFESAVETPYSRFLTRYAPGTQVSLSRLPARIEFAP